MLTVLRTALEMLDAFLDEGQDAGYTPLGGTAEVLAVCELC